MSAVSLADTRPNIEHPSWVCACGDEQGALYYACRHNKSPENDTPILIVFEAGTSEAIVDGRDFLYKVFELGDPKRSRPIVEKVFGEAILKYFDRAWSGNPNERVPLCDLAVQDNAVVLAHASNRTVLAGRYGTCFRSAFGVRTPVAADRIVGLSIVGNEIEMSEGEVSIYEITR
jgi:hypothetical protein